MSLDNKISFMSGFSFTALYTMPFMEITMALLLGIVGGFGGMIGKSVFDYLRKIF
jgi:hypothetical protein